MPLIRINRQLVCLYNDAFDTVNYSLLNKFKCVAFVALYITGWLFI